MLSILCVGAREKKQTQNENKCYWKQIYRASAYHILHPTSQILEWQLGEVCESRAKNDCLAPEKPSGEEKGE